MNDVKVKLTIAKAPARLGFGYPLIFQGMATKAVEYTECFDLDAVKTAGFADGSEVYKNAQILFAQDNPPEKIAVCASTSATIVGLESIFDKGWRQLIVASIGTDGDSTAEAIAAYIEGKKDKAFFVTVADVAGATAITADGKTFDRTFVVMHPTNDCAAAAVVGATAGAQAGSITYKNIIVKDVLPVEITDGDLTALHTAGAVTIVQKAGDIVTSEGICSSGEYMDIVDSKDYIIQQITYYVQKLLNRSAKVPYDNRGISAIENEVVTVLKDAYNNGMIAVKDDGTPDYSTNFKSRSETDPRDRAVRKYIEGSFTFGLAGAVHEVEIEGEIVV